MLDFLRDLPLNLPRLLSETFEWALMSFVSHADDADIQTDDDGNIIRRPIWKTLLFLPVLLPIWIFKICLAIIIFPFAAFSFEDERRTRFLYGLPAFVGILTTLVVSLVIFLNQKSVTARYVTLMQLALQSGDYKLASTLGGRLMSESTERKPELAYQYAMALARSGDAAKATSIINSLAPEKTTGYAPAHHQRAVQAFQSLGSSPSEEQLASLRWHLDKCGGTKNEQILLLWANYYNRIGQPSPAIDKMEQAAKLNPTHLITLAQMFKAIGNDANANRTLESGKETFKRIVEKEPLNSQARISLALILAQLAQLDEAEKVLQSGLNISKGPDIMRALSDFYLLKFDMSNEKSSGFRESFDYLDRAIRLDANYTPIYDRLIRLYGMLKSDEERDEIIRLLEEMIVDGKNAATAHFTLGSILTLSGKSEDSLYHLQKAFLLSPNMPVLCNNLAWLLATTDATKLDEALQLSRQAVKAVPKSVNFHDTLGTILLLKGDNEGAILELEFGLDQRSSDKQLHAKLAKAYNAIGKKEIAKMHFEKSR
jgi:tetratricopeptide (TPR) repeat protein